MTVGTKQQVWNKTAEQTSGGLKRKDLKKNKQGKVVSKEKSKLAKKNLAKWRSAVKVAVKDEKNCPLFVKKGTRVYREAKKIFKSK